MFFRKRSAKLKYGKVIGRKSKNKILVEFKNGKRKVLTECEDLDLEIGATGDFFYKGNLILTFERDIWTGELWEKRKTLPFYPK